MALTVTSLPIILSGCGGDGDSEPEVVLDYVIEADKQPEEIPEDLRKPRDDGGRLEEDNKWVVVTFEVDEGTLDMEDVWFRSRVETDERFYDLDHVTDELKNGVQSRGEIKQGSSGIALYQIPEDVSNYEWNLEDMRQDVEAKL